MALLPRTNPPNDGPVLERLRARTDEVGGSPVRRLLPSRRRTVGAWCFVDHFGPVEAGPRVMQVPPHPHIGLQTVTWLLEGCVLHTDSLGSRQLVRPGQVNWMTAGRGIAHAEEGQPEAIRHHGVQLWVALPDAHRHTEPAFDHIPEVPSMEIDGGRLTLIVGELEGLVSTARTFSPLLGAQLDLGGRTGLSLEPGFEHAAVVLEGRATIEGEASTPGELLYLGRGRSSLTVEAEGRVLLLGGEPLDEPLLMWWNLVARTEAEIREARAAWEEGRLAGPVEASRPRLPAPALPG